MRAEDGELHRIEVDARDLKQLSVYEPSRPFSPIGVDEEYFYVMIPSHLTQHILGETTRIWTQAKSRTRPTVDPGAKSIDGLMRQLLVMDARNMSRDRVFDGETLELTVKTYYYERNYPMQRRGYGLALKSIKFLSDRSGC